jgi:hypothetical protein
LYNPAGVESKLKKIVLKHLRNYYVLFENLKNANLDYEDDEDDNVSVVSA